MTPHEKVMAYIPLVDFLSDALGGNYEVVLHDLSGGGDTIVAIGNSHITGRNVGANIDNSHTYLLKYFDQNKRKNYIANYSGKTSKGKSLRSSTYFIKDQDQIIGFMCINCDITAYREVRESLDRMIAQPMETILYKRDRNDETDIRSIVDEIISQTTSGLDTDAMSTDEKRRIVELLNERGVFLFKGALSDVAKHLDISMQTLYRYLKEIGEGSGNLNRRN